MADLNLTNNKLVEKKFEKVHGECLFSPDLTERQQAIIVGFAHNAFDRVMDIDLLASYDSEAATWMNENEYAKAVFQSNGNLCYYLTEQIQKMTSISHVERILDIEEEIDGYDEPKRSQYEAAINKTLLVNRVLDISISTKDIGLIDNIQAFRDEQGQLQIRLKWCLTAAKVDKSQASEDNKSFIGGQFRKGCPSGGAIEKLVRHSLTEQYKKLLDPSHWQKYGEEIPENLATSLINPIRRKTIEEETGIEDGSPYHKEGRFNQKLFDWKKANLNKDIYERLEDKVERAKKGK